MIIKGAICVVTSVFFVIINTIILFLKPQFSYAKNDQENFCVYFQKWVGTLLYMGTIIVSLLCIYFSVELSLYVSYSFLVIECILLVAYALCKYKCVTVNGDNIKVERLFKKELNTTFSAIERVTYIPNAKLVFKLKKKEQFDVSFNSENFRRLYRTLLKHDLKFKTGRIPEDENHVYIAKYNITIDFPKTMFREYYQNDTYLKNSKYLFSARSLEKHEYLEGYSKESPLSIKEFCELIKKDMNHDGFKYSKSTEAKFDGLDFLVLKSIGKKDDSIARLAYIYHSNEEYFVMYADILTKDEESFNKKMSNSIRKSLYEDGKSRLARI